MISIVIPAYEMQGCGVEMLADLLESIRAQTYVNYEVVISNDNCVTADSVLPDGWRWQSNILWTDGKKGAPANLNNAIDHSIGDIIKPMFQDDKFLEPDSLQKIAHAFYYSPAKWIACKSQNGGEAGMRDDLFEPYPHTSVFRLSEGENTYGSPSAMAWRRNDLRFEEKLHWLFDCEFYGRMAELHGVPTFVDTPIYIRQWSGMATHTVANGYQRVEDHNFVVEKFRARGEAV